MIAFRNNLRFWMVVGLLTVGSLVTFCHGAIAQTTATRASGTRATATQPPAIRATRDLEIARLRFKLYERVDYPLRVRHMRTEIKFAEARVNSLRRRVKEAERFYRSKALFTTIENLRLELLEAELQLKDRKHELTLLQIHNQDERRLRQLLIESAHYGAVQITIPR